LTSHGTPAPGTPPREAGFPDSVPVLSRGRHRSPRSGACFMEMASFLAGERWSDHPPCTHPLLAAVARRVNDYTSEAGRSQLAVLIPSVIGLTTEDLRADAGIALLCATTALPRVAPEHQRVLAVSVLTCEKVLANLDQQAAQAWAAPARQALDRSPDATAWAGNFTQRVRTSVRGFRRQAAPGTVRYAVDALARASLPDADDVLHDLLVATIAECARHVRAQTPAPGVGEAEWAAACALTRRRAPAAR
jgi:hypothetical protein